jgi:NhaP-type Na+/H+ or K+/H+ antiporter
MPSNNRLVVALVGLGSALLLSFCTAAKSGKAEQCGHELARDHEDETQGHALLATSFKRTKIFSDQVPAHNSVEQELELLPKGWTAVFSEDEGRTYYLNSATGESQWEKPQVTSSHDQLLQEVANASTRDANVVVNAVDVGASVSRGEPLDSHDLDYIKDDDGPWLKGFYPNGTYDPTDNGTIVLPHEPVEKKHALARYFVAPLAAVFFIVFTLSNLMEKFGITAIPESAIVIAIGVCLGMFMKQFATEAPTDDSFGKINSAILNLVLLPILMFDAGWSLRRQDFYSQFPYILMFAMVGVAISTAVIAGLIWATSSLHGVTSLRVALAYASLISATDPVATLGTYSKLKVDPLLNILVFGEATINDAVAITLFSIFNSETFMVKENGEPQSSYEVLASITWGVGKIFGGSVGMGILLGMGYTLVANWADMRHNKKGQILVILASCYLTYAAAESLGMSGIIAVMFCAITMGVYMRPHLSTEGYMLANFMIKQIATLADTGVFLLVGVSVMQLTTKGWKFGCYVMLFCLIGRFCSTYPVAYTVNIMKKVSGAAHGEPDGVNMLSSKLMFMMWHAGLRGGIALALSLELGKWVDKVDGEGTRRALQTATFLLIVAFLLVFGSTTSPCLKALGIPINQDADEDVLSAKEGSFLGPARKFLDWLDKSVLNPLLIGTIEKEEDDKDVVAILKKMEHY